LFRTRRGHAGATGNQAHFIRPQILDSVSKIATRLFLRGRGSAQIYGNTGHCFNVLAGY
jgi:hypothetical protein